MCDHSLFTVQNRLAEEGEELVLYRFATGTLGFASVSDLAELEADVKCEADHFWSAIKAWFLPQRSTRPPAICIPPGASLLLGDVPPPVQASLCIGSAEVVVFTEVSSQSYSYRDALLLPNGTRVLLQDLPEGLHAVVLFTSPESATKAHAEVYAA